MLPEEQETSSIICKNLELKKLMETSPIKKRIINYISYGFLVLLGYAIRMLVEILVLD